MMGPTGLFGVAMNELAKENENLSVVTADLTSFSGLERYAKENPEKFYNVGIAEQNMVGVSAGLAKEGFCVFTGTYASFACTRALDQVRVNMGYMKLPIKLVGLASGFASGILGATHMALEDVAILRSIPNITILSPADCTEAMKCFEASMDWKEPVYIRLTGTQRMPSVYKEDYVYKIGENHILNEGRDICLLATGSMVSPALKVAKKLLEYGVETMVVDVHTLKPFEEKLIEYAMGKKLIVTLEEHSILGGLGSIVSERLAEKRNAPTLLRLGTKDEYLHAAGYLKLLELSGLTENTIVDKILSVLDLKREERW
jgi:transketolase